MSTDAITRLAAEVARLTEDNDRLQAAMVGRGVLSSLDLETILRVLPSLLFIIDNQDRYADFRLGAGSPPFVPPEAFLGRGLVEVLPEPPGRAILEAVHRVRAGRGAEVIEYLLPMPAGRLSYEARLVPLDDGRVAILVFEVTERVRNAETLHARLVQQSSVARLGLAAIEGPGLQELLDAAVVAVAEGLGVEYAKVLELRPNGESLLIRAGVGWRPGLVGRADVGVGPDSQAGYTLGANRAVVVDDLASDPRFDGPPLLREHGVVSGLSVVIRGRSRPYGVLGAHTRDRRRFGEDDVTFLESVANVLASAAEREQAEGMVRASEERFRSLIQRSSDLIAILDAAGAIRFVSSSVEGILGFRDEELLGRNSFELIHPDDRESAGAEFGPLSATPGMVHRFTMRYLHRDGSCRVLESTAVNLAHLPEVGGVVVNSRDITDQRRLEDQLEQARRLESIGRLAGGIAHDFNNVLTAILGNTELLGLSTPPGAGGEEELEEIRRSVHRARDLVHQLLAFARKQVLAPKVVDLNTLVRDAERMLQRVVRENVVLRLCLSEDPWPVLADPTQMEQVIVNLVVNARDAMPEGGTLTIETANVRLDPADPLALAGALLPGPHVGLTVRDTGTGMTPEVLARVFEPFYSTKAGGEGTGLGLATVYGIVRQSGGLISASSEAGAGSAFTVYLPQAMGSARDERPPEALPPVGGSETILLVEDDAGVRDTARRMLERVGYRLLVAGGPEEALALEAGFPGAIDLLVTDVVMAGMSGTVMAEHLLARRPGLTALYMSGYTEDVIIHRGMLEREINFLPKPFSGAELLAKTRELLDARRSAAGQTHSGKG